MLHGAVALWRRQRHFGTACRFATVFVLLLLHAVRALARPHAFHVRILQGF